MHVINKYILLLVSLALALAPNTATSFEVEESDAVVLEKVPKTIINLLENKLPLSITSTPKLLKIKSNIKELIVPRSNSEAMKGFKTEFTAKPDLQPKHHFNQSHIDFAVGVLRGTQPVAYRKNSRQYGVPLINGCTQMYGISTHGYFGYLNAGAIHIASLVEYLTPGRKTTDGDSIQEVLIGCVKQFLSSGYEPKIQGQYDWAVSSAASTLALARYTETVWSRLTHDEKNRAEFLMRIVAATANLLYNAAHDCYMPPSLSGNGGYMPNQRNVEYITYAYIFFGDDRKVNDELDQFDLDKYMNKMEEFGWTRLRSYWNTNYEALKGFTNGSSPVQKVFPKCKTTSMGLKRPFEFRGRVVADIKFGGSKDGKMPVPFSPFDIFYREEIEFMWGLEVVNNSSTYFFHPRCSVSNHYTEEFGTNSRVEFKGYMCGDSECKTSGRSKYTGQAGMSFEFNTGQGRSSYHYVSYGIQKSIRHYSTIVALGFWKSGTPLYDKAKRQAFVGMDHFFSEVQVRGWKDASFVTCFETKNFEQGDLPAKYIFEGMFKNKLNWRYAPPNQN